MADDKLRLIRADLMEQQQKPRGLVKIVSGNVLFRKGDVNLACQKAYWYDYKDQIDFYIDVVVTNEDRKLTADSLTYYYDEDRIVAMGKPVVVDSQRTIRAKKLEYFTETDIVHGFEQVEYSTADSRLLSEKLTFYADSSKTIASNNCKFIDLKENNILQSDSILYYNEKDEMRAFINPVLIKRDSLGNEEYRIEGDVISGDKNEASFLSIGNVRIFQEDIVAYGDSANYNDSTETIILTGNPKVLNEDQTLKGEIIEARLREGEINNIHIIGRAIATSTGTAFLPFAKDDTLQTVRDSVKVRDEMTGKEMEIYFEKGNIDSLRVSGMATSFYNVTEDSVIQGTNSASGDTVVMQFDNKSLNEITVIGGTQGKFVPHESNRSMDTTVVYAAERIDYYIQDRQTDLLKNSSVAYEDAELTAGKIRVMWNENLLYAYPDDTTTTDSLDSSWPQMVQQGREPFTGKEMIYNIKTRRGRIYDGRTHMDDGYYYGENIKKKGKKTFYINDGVYTTCDKVEPHFHFQSQKMKMIQKDKIFARPIVMYIHDIPLLALPFAVIPNKGGKRRSGWIMPTYGNNSNVGNYLRGLGYFWVVNDYTDLKLTTDFFDKKGIRMNVRNRYKVRYKIDGNIFVSYHDMMLQDYPERIWRLKINHNHNISPTSSFRANGEFVNQDQYMKKNAIDLENRLNQQLISNATYSKKWRNRPYSLSGNMRQTINLQATEKIKTEPNRASMKQAYVTRTFPSLSLRRSTERLIPLRKGQSAGEAKWYNEIRYSISSQLRNKQDIYYQSVAENDSVFKWQKKNEVKNGVENNISINSSQKLFSYFSVNQNISLQEDWIFEMEKPVYDSTGNIIVEEGAVKTVTRTGFFPRHTGSMSVGINTKIYGLFPVKIGALRAVRHVLTPSVNMSYRPDFTKDLFGWDPGYVTHYQDEKERELKYDPFQNTLIGSTPSSESKTMSISLRNNFQAKTEKDGEENKFDLFTMNVNMNHNFAADSMNWSEIRTSIRTKLKNLNLDFSMIHDPYRYDTDRRRRINEWHDEIYSVPVPRLTTLRASTGISIKSSDFGSSAATDDSTAETGGTTTKASNLWSANMNFNYDMSKTNPDNKSERFNMRISAKLNLTKNWKISYSASVDLMERILYGQQFSVERDLHCWRMSFNWTPSGYGKQYSLLISVKAPVLSDLKYEERGGRRRSAYF